LRIGILMDYIALGLLHLLGCLGWASPAANSISLLDTSPARRRRRESPSATRFWG
jgi:hypothetical protein